MYRGGEQEFAFVLLLGTVLGNGIQFLRGENIGEQRSRHNGPGGVLGEATDQRIHQRHRASPWNGPRKLPPSRHSTAELLFRLVLDENVSARTLPCFTRFTDFHRGLTYVLALKGCPFHRVGG